MKIDNILLDKLTAQAQVSPRLRRVWRWHSLRALESGTVILEMKDGAYEPISAVDILSM